MCKPQAVNFGGERIRESLELHIIWQCESGLANPELWRVYTLGQDRHQASEELGFMLAGKQSLDAMPNP
jgi:hypothetical protein